MYDAADRLTDNGYDYDPFGRVTHIPASSAGGDPLDITYYTNDRAHTLTQDGREVELKLDPLLRPRSQKATNAELENLYYDNESDEPTFAKQASRTLSFVRGIAVSNGPNVNVKISMGENGNVFYMVEARARLGPAPLYAIAAVSSHDPTEPAPLFTTIRTARLFQGQECASWIHSNHCGQCDGIGQLPKLQGKRNV